MGDLEKDIFDRISKNEVTELKTLLLELKSGVDFVDENGMTPLQHACYKGNKEIVQMFLDRGADVNASKHEYSYTALHFAALSGNVDVCLLLLHAGANANDTNSVGRTAAQMASFVSNHRVVAVINNYVPKQEIEYYTVIQGQQTEPYLPAVLLDSFHKFVIQVNMHPVKIALTLQRLGGFADNLKTIRKVLGLMSEHEVQRKSDINEAMSFKFHYLGYVVSEIIKCREYFQARKEAGSEMKNDFVELFAKRVLKEGKHGILDYLEWMIRECVRDFPFREFTIFKQIVSQLANKDNEGAALDVIKWAIYGQRGFQDTVTYCSSCGEEKPDKKCSKCKEVQYCDRECQRLHWFMHKKTCTRPEALATNASGGGPSKKEVDVEHISSELQNLMTN
ncbi:ankyrin repeat and MYND domain-containing protein 2 [Phlebotomus argentipes]|uniref:ankyrin repeat and MYND domain-containing protein 2 n=1 Tax=Phlebotomus argentipes TaxID=94469 RepID=UPI002892B131|nr:ankyrin repeat and MYND domain-containing protein 2 [Phlebotomus argentipes]